MCGGCRRCLHDQGLDCGNPDCRICAMRQDDEYWDEEDPMDDYKYRIENPRDEERGE